MNNRVGSEFETDFRFKLVANIIVDFFRGRVVENINLAGLDHVIVLSLGEGKDKVLFRRYGIQMKKSGTKVPKVELVEVGPSVDLELRRHHLASIGKDLVRLFLTFVRIGKRGTPSSTIDAT